MHGVSPAPSVEGLQLFLPSVREWFCECFAAPSQAQTEAWSAIKTGAHTLIAAPTGSGKTLAAFLAAIDDLVRQGLEGPLPDETQVIYVSPLKALSNDIHRNLEMPLAGIRQHLRKSGLPEVEIRTWVRTGDTPASDRARMRRRPPHILVTTPESLYVLLGSESGRASLATARTIIIDEIHAVAANKRGVHLALSLERLDALCGNKLLRIGLSATQNPIGLIADFLLGASAAGDFKLVDAGHRRARDLGIVVPRSPLEAVMSNDVWREVYDQLADLIRAHRTTLVFVNTRRMAERVAHELSQRLGETTLTAHHGSMAKERRLLAEQRLKYGKLSALVATASLELGIDIGEVDLVCQLGSPRSIANFLQRVGRSGHAIAGSPKGRLFPLSRDDLVECAALLDCVRRGELDRATIPQEPLDVLAQQIVAEVSAQEWSEGDLYDLVRRAWPYRELKRKTFDAVVLMLAEGFTTPRGRRGALIHHDAVHQVLRARRGARMTALTSGGTIPDTADYQVLLEPENQIIGSVNEDFAVESMAGDVFQLGNASYRIQRVERGTVRVEDAHGQPPNIPFWIGEAPGRTDELSLSVSRLRAEIAARLRDDDTGNGARRWLIEQLDLDAAAAEQLVEYLAAAAAALGCLPTQDTIVLERFFDEAGGMQLVVHAPFGSRINRAWGLALRKRFCRKFNFELQAAATEDCIVLSLTTAHSFDLIEVARYLHSQSVRTLLIQAMLDAPMFITRWRWVAGVALALPRFRAGKKTPPQLLRMQAEDLLAAVFPDQIACAENLVGEREIPDHPLTNQAIFDCLHEAMDIDGLERVLRRLESGEINVVACDLANPSPFALEVLSAKPYAFLDDAPLEERRTQAVMARRWQDPQSASDLGKLDPEAISAVKAEAWPDPTNAEELHDALLWIGFLTPGEVEAEPNWRLWLEALARDGRATLFTADQTTLWIAAERLNQFQAMWPEPLLLPKISAPGHHARPWSREEALIEVMRARLEGLGPVTPTALMAPLGLRSAEVDGALKALEVEGSIMRGRFIPDANEDQWCNRGLLARIHRYTIRRIRSQIEPVAVRDYFRFLFDWQHVTNDSRLLGRESLPAALSLLEGFEAPAFAWEAEILPARVADYQPNWLDAECVGGRVTWTRLNPSGNFAAPVRTTPVALVERRRVRDWMSFVTPAQPVELSSRAQAVVECLTAHGALFFDELSESVRLLRPELEQTLSELVALGLVNSDSFGGLRVLMTPSDRRKPIAGARRRGRTLAYGMESAGRWGLVRGRAHTLVRDDDAKAASVEQAARALLRRYGVVFWRLLAREGQWLPPWRELLHVYRNLEARGEIRGGRFVAGFSGEQYALPEAVGLLREARRRPQGDEWISVSGADFLNLIGILTPGPRLPSLTGNRLLYRDGLPVATLSGGNVNFLTPIDEHDEWEARKKLMRSAG